MVEFILFFTLLLSVALFHRYSSYIALLGAIVLLTYKLIFVSSFNLLTYVSHEWHLLLNILGLLFGFSILAKYVEESHLAEKMANFLPKGFWGNLSFLFLVFILSSFLDNIAAAVIGGTLAMMMYQKRVHIGFLVAIVAASNAGGVGSVIGDTTTTMMWISGISALLLLKGFVGAFAAFAVFAPIASWQQYKFAEKISFQSQQKIEIKKLIFIGLMVICTIMANYHFDFPAAGLWVGILLTHIFSKVSLKEMKHASSSVIFLCSLIVAASLMPVSSLPSPSTLSTFVIGLVSSVFDNIPLTKLAIDQGGYSWPLLAFAVGFGGSMTWFGSSAGVALSGLFPELKSMSHYLKSGWYVFIAYVVGFFVQSLI